LAIPDYQTLLLPVLKVASEGETRVPAAAEKIADQLGLSEEEREEMLPSGKQRLLHNRVHWAKFYMSKAGLIASPKRGVFTASQAGKDLLAKAPAKIDVDLLKQYPSFVEFVTTSNAGSTSTEEKPTAPAATSSATPEEQVDAAQKVLHAALRADLLQRIGDNSAAFFEGLIVDLLVAMGYGGTHENAALRLGKSGDGGVDGVIDEDRLGLDRIYVQAKRWDPAKGIGRQDVQGFVGSLVGFGATKGVFVTTSYFSANAKAYVQHLPQRVILIDGERLTELMIEHDVGVRLSRAVKIKKLDEDFFAEDGSY
jgi:restriction system protein